MRYVVSPDNKINSGYTGKMKIKNNEVQSRLLIGMLAALWSVAASSEIIFEDDSVATNMTGYTETWGASWGDVNADNWPDLFNQGHRDYPRFYRNTGEGSFQDIAYEMDRSLFGESKLNAPLIESKGRFFRDSIEIVLTSSFRQTQFFNLFL